MGFKLGLMLVLARLDGEEKGARSKGVDTISQTPHPKKSQTPHPKIQPRKFKSAIPLPSLQTTSLAREGEAVGEPLERRLVWVALVFSLASISAGLRA